MLCLFLFRWFLWQNRFPCFPSECRNIFHNNHIADNVCWTKGMCLCIECCNISIWWFTFIGIRCDLHTIRLAESDNHWIVGICGVDGVSASLAAGFCEIKSATDNTFPSKYRFIRCETFHRALRVMEHWTASRGTYLFSGMKGYCSSLTHPMHISTNTKPVYQCSKARVNALVISFIAITCKVKGGI